MDFLDAAVLKTIQASLGILCLIGGIMLLSGRKTLEKLGDMLNKPVLSIEKLRAFLDTEISMEHLREFLEKKIPTDTLRERLDDTILIDKALLKWITFAGVVGIITALYLIITCIAY